jgi:hypothetical protein
MFHALPPGISKTHAKAVGWRPCFALRLFFPPPNKRVLIEAPKPLQALQGDDYQLEYYEDGYPKLSECLRRARVMTADNPFTVLAGLKE